MIQSVNKTEVHDRLPVIVVFCHGWGVRGRSAAATRRPSSASRLYVEQAFLCVKKIRYMD